MGTIEPMTCALPEVLAELEQIAPLELAASWDNVGLLIEPQPVAEAWVSRVLLTIDLTEPVLREAFDDAVELIVAYHPPIFSGLKRLTQRTASERIALEAARGGIYVFSPHTALDACQGGVNDWLVEPFGPGRRTPIEPHPDSPSLGQGRLALLDAPLELDDAVARIKAHLGLVHVRVARPHGADAHEVRSVAVCAGAGGSVLEKVEADLYVTGEMRHHDIIARQSQNRSVVVCDHTNTERGYLPSLATALSTKLSCQLHVAVSKRDADPLWIV